MDIKFEREKTKRVKSIVSAIKRFARKDIHPSVQQEAIKLLSKVVETKKR